MTASASQTIRSPSTSVGDLAVGVDGEVGGRLLLTPYQVQIDELDGDFRCRATAQAFRGESTSE